MAAEIIPIFQSADYRAQVGRAAQSLRDGKLVVLPTETVYGAAGLLTHPDARRRLRTLRPGDEARPLTPHLAGAAQAADFLGPISELARRMLRKLWPGPVALVFEVPDERRRQVAAKLGVAETDLYDNGRITLRCPDHIVATDVLAAVDAPVVATLAGSSSDPSAGTVRFDTPTLDAADLVLDAGPPRYAKPSTIIAVTDDGYRIEREGVFDARIIDRLLQTTLLFICSGNTCRSPMAEAIGRKILSDRLRVVPQALEEKGFTVISAGSMAMPGSRAAAPAVQAVAELGADLSGHRSRPLTIELIHQADLIFPMSVAHARAVLAMVPGAVDKIVPLDPAGDIEDPIGGDIALYQGLSRQLHALILARLKEHQLV